jgi:branched-chain amino acid transport system ATP-binding protein
MADTLLKVTDLKVAYGGIQAVKGASLEVKAGELVSLIGANGAGKTTTLKAITGIQAVASGSVEYLGRPILGQGPWELVKQGLVMVPEGRGVFTRMTITENLQMGAFVRRDNEINADIDKVFALFPRLKERRDQRGGTLSGGEQQMLAIGRAMMARPRLLLLDEPSLGLAPKVVEQIRDVIVDVNTEGTSILLVEQNAALALGIADFGYVLESGRVVLDGPAGKLLANDDIREFYLGMSAAAGERTNYRAVKHYRRRKRWLS